MRRTLVVAAIVVAVLAGGVAVAQTAQRFSDVPADHPQADAIAWAAETGLTAGYEDGTFRPDEPLPRWAAMIFMERFYDDVLQATASDGFTRGDMMELLHTINNASSPVSASAMPTSDPSACAALRRGRYYTHPGSVPARVDVTVVSVAFDDLAVPDETYTASMDADPAQNFTNEMLDALETKLEALAHGRTDWVFNRRGSVTLPRSAHNRAQPTTLGRRTLAGVTSELRRLYPGEHLLAFTTVSQQFPYTSFYSDGVAVAAVEALATLSSARSARQSSS